jgi:hypothetical protein
MLNPLEIGALGDGEALQVAVQAIEAEFDGAEANPVAAAMDARAARFDALLGGDCEMDAAAEIDTVGAVVDFDEHGERVARAGLLARCARDRLGRLAAQFGSRSACRRAPGWRRFRPGRGRRAAAEHLQPSSKCFD